MIETEIMLWSRLKSRQLLGYKVRHQYGVGKYVIDFYCPQIKLGVEVDGESHFTAEGLKHDKERDNFISSKGIEFIRLTTTEIRKDLDGVVEYLADEFQKRDNHW